MPKRQLNNSPTAVRRRELQKVARGKKANGEVVGLTDKLRKLDEGQRVRLVALLRRSVGAAKKLNFTLQRDDIVSLLRDALGLVLNNQDGGFEDVQQQSEPRRSYGQYVSPRYEESNVGLAGKVVKGVAGSTFNGSLK